jgi:TolA-binding protein
LKHWNDKHSSGNKTASLVEMRNLLLEVDDFINSPDYPAQSAEERSRLQSARKELLQRIEQAESTDNASAAPTVPISAAGTASAKQSSPESFSRAEEVREHSPAAEQQMEVAEKLFYSGRYGEAIQLFDRVLQMEPNWERARQHRSEAENYLRTG